MTHHAAEQLEALAADVDDVESAVEQVHAQEQRGAVELELFADVHEPVHEAVPHVASHGILGLVPARLSVRVGLALVLLGVLCAVAAWLQWDAELALVLLGSNLGWIFGPAWAVHLATSKAGRTRAD